MTSIIYCLKEEANLPRENKKFVSVNKIVVEKHSPYDTLQKAIDAAEDNTVIKVSEGVYKCNGLTIT